MMPAPVIVFASLGVAAGGMHFVLLGRDAERLVRGGAALSSIGWRLGRLALTVALLVWAATNGAAPLLAAACGVLVARHLVISRLEPQS